MIETELTTEEEYRAHKILIRNLIDILIKEGVLLVGLEEQEDPVIEADPTYIVEYNMDQE